MVPLDTQTPLNGSSCFVKSSPYTTRISQGHHNLQYLALCGVTTSASRNILNQEQRNY